MSKTSTIVIALTAAIFSSGAALAHPQLKTSEPAAGAATSSPKQIRITFNEAVIPKFSGIEIKDQAGRPIATRKSQTDPADKKRLVVPLKEELVPGEYKVDWHAVSDDTHRVKGTYSFSVTR
ncbi:copper resistance protein C [Afipia carboxidovorans OM5]|jgi:methionine-rich copper-binding protein CopC|uniref:Copper resistance protein C n=1 Tax=Afipia carboxidovorans (strain ATCC 49405 / DSM 1227 / KCTC 32145 / OM5) TaxID=504832 RepID=F8BWA4_AFIC5|nr:copper homeostasis periplasmic binding protein CopC [Afipia carboxidovorans]AEI01667.1 copper resistance protein C [Afipia carboxidovorans OM4]AEI05242.1 copper resistance protein C [Afipia carboxidovorans OM5]